MRALFVLLFLALVIMKHRFARGLVGCHQQARSRYACRLSSTTALLGDLSQIVHKHMMKECNVGTNDTLLLSVSGGLDSVAMLHLMARIPSLLPRLHVINFNHKLRAEADEEAAFVSSLAQAYRIPFHAREWLRASTTTAAAADIIEKDTSFVGMQAAARDWRRSECLSLAVQLSKQKDSKVLIATAHHADDQLETSLLKLLRGAHLSRLYPMLALSDCGRFIKPMLSVNKKQLKAYLQEQGLEWREDESNEKLIYKRNAVRLDLVPTMARLAGGLPALKKRFVALEQQSKELHDFLLSETTAFISQHVEPKDFIAKLQLTARLNNEHDEEEKEEEEEQRRNVCSSGTSEMPSSPLPLISFSVDPKSSKFASLAPMLQTEVIHSLFRLVAHISLDYDQAVSLRELASQNLTHGVRSKEKRVDDVWIAVRIGAVMRFERKQRESHQQNTSVDDAETVSFSPSPTTLNTHTHTTRLVCSDGKVISVTHSPHILIKAHDITSLSSSPSPTPSPSSSPIPSSSSLRGRGEEVGYGLVSLGKHHLSSTSDNLLIRLPRQGDKFCPSWRERAIPLASYLRGQSVPLHLRDFVPIVVKLGKGREELEIIAVAPVVAKGFESSKSCDESYISFSILAN